MRELNDEIVNNAKRVQRALKLSEDEQLQIKRLNEELQRAWEMVDEHKEYDQVINERDILGTQLIRRNDELALLYEKIKIQQSTLHKGEAQYSDRIQEIRLLKIELQDMMRKLRISTEKTAHIPKIKRELYNTQRELLAERTKNKAMSDELVNPMNVHRWRKLAGTYYQCTTPLFTLTKFRVTGTDPHAHEMI